MNRGSSTAMPPSNSPPGSFNEAPIHESGKFRNRGVVPPSILSFNEAPIHESGKCSVTGGPTGIWRSFNEAPIHESGKSADPGVNIQRAPSLQ